MINRSIIVLYNLWILSLSDKEAVNYLKCHYSFLEGCFMRDFTKAFSRKDLVLFIVPVLLSELAQEACNLISTGVISHYLDYKAVAVIGAMNPYASMQHYIFVDMIVGFGVYVMRCIGTKDQKAIRRGFGGALWCSVLLGIIAIILGLFAVQPLLSLVNVPDELRAEAVLYLRVLLFGCGLLGLKNLFTAAIQGAGETILISVVSAVGIVTHMLLVILLITVFHMGVEASAMAMLLNNFWQVVVLLFRVWKEPLLSISLSLDVFRDREERGELLKNGVSKAGMTILVGVGSFFMQREINGLSTELLAGYSYAAGTLNGFFMQPLEVCATAAQVSAAQNYGSANYRLLRVYVRKMIYLSLVFSAALIGICYLGGHTLMRMLAGTGAPEEVLRAGTFWMMVCSPTYPLLALIFICRNCIQVLGGYWEMQALGLTEMCVTIFMALVAVPKMGYPAVCLSVAVSWTVCGLMALWFYRKKAGSLYGIQSSVPAR